MTISYSNGCTGKPASYRLAERIALNVVWLGGEGLIDEMTMPYTMSSVTQRTTYAESSRGATRMQM